jgi:uncharacterized protein YecA (UPF0149 family)
MKKILLVDNEVKLPKPKKKNVKMIAIYNSSEFGTLKKKRVEPGRNRPCICGSGKKYKACCLDKVNAQSRKAVIEASKKTQEINR